MPSINFSSAFQALTGNLPFPWQQAMYDLMAKGSFDELVHCNLPTGLGKTSVVAIWLVALANAKDKLPRRLVYVLIAGPSSTKPRTRLKSYEPICELPVCLNLLGNCARFRCEITNRLSPQHASRSVRRQPRVVADPARRGDLRYGRYDRQPVIVQRLWRRLQSQTPSRRIPWPRCAVFVHDEAHLEKPFQDLLTEVKNEQQRCHEFGTFRVMELSATSRSSEKPFELTKREKNGEVPVVRDRLFAKKGIEPIAAERAKVAQEITRLALRHVVLTKRCWSSSAPSTT